MQSQQLKCNLFANKLPSMEQNKKFTWKLFSLNLGKNGVLQ